MSGHLILLVEDDRLTEAVQRRQLEQAGFVVFSVPRGSDALVWAAALPVAAVLLDISLPDMDGAVVALHLSRLEPPVPVIAMTALCEDSDAKRAACDGIRLAGFWQKPLDEEKIDFLRTAGAIDSGSLYGVRDPVIAADIRQMLGGREDSLRQSLMAQMKDFTILLVDRNGPELAFAAHALKSSALAMGYRQFAALLGAIESTAHAAPAVLASNRQALLACLNSFSLRTYDEASLNF